MILTGIFRIGRDAEVRFTPAGDAVTNLSLVYNYGTKKDASGNRPSQWVDASLFGKRCEALAPYLLKGTMISCVLNNPHIEEFKKNDGTISTKLAATVSDLEFAGSNQPAASTPKPTPTPPPRPAASIADMDDDVPF
jgi:single-strand DNA-binding protein